MTGLHPARAGPSRPPLATAAAAAAAVAFAGAALLVLARLGAEPRALDGLAIGLVLAGAAAAGVAGGTLRLAAWLTGGRDLDGASATVVAVVVLAFAWPALPATGLAAGLVLGAVLVAPGLRAWGAPTLPAWLEAASGSRLAGAVAACVVVAVGTALGGAALDALAVILARALPLDRVASTGLAAGIVAAVVLPGGVRSLVRAGLVLGVAGAVALAVLLHAGPDAAADLPGRLAEGLSRPEGVPAVLATALAVAVMPPVLVAALPVAEPSQARPALLRAAVAVLLLGGLAVPAPVSGGASTVLHACGALAAAAACAVSAAAALAGASVARPDRPFVARSRRFAWQRAILLVVVGAMAAVVLWLPVQRIVWPAVALAAGALAPAAILLRLVPRPSGAALVAALATGTASVLLVLDGHLGGTSLGAGAAGLIGAAGGVAAGLAATLVRGRAGPEPPVLPADDRL